MRVVAATGNGTAPLEVDRDSIRVEASYFSIVPRRLNVVEGGGVDWASAPTPHITGAASNTTNIRFFMATFELAPRMDPSQDQRACPSPPPRYNPATHGLTMGYTTWGCLD